LTEHLGGAKIYLKREDLCHTGAHKINNSLAQVLLAKRMGKTRVVAETGAGQHGVATATAAAMFGLDCEVYMGTDMWRASPERVPHEAPRDDRPARGQRSKTLKDAHQRGHARLDHERGEHPLRARHGLRPPSVPHDGAGLPVRHRPRGEEAIAKMEGRLPDCLVACVAAARMPWDCSMSSLMTRR